MDMLKRAWLPLFLAASGCAAVGGRAQGADPAEAAAWQSRTEAGLAAAREGRFEEAERQFLAALAALTTIPDNEGRVVRSLNHLGAVYQSTRRLEAAESTLRKALEFSEKSLGAGHPDTAMTLRALSAVQAARRDAAGAEASLRRAVEILEKAGEPSDLAARLEEAGALCAAQKRNREASEWFERALGAWERALGPEHPDLAARLDAVARFYAAQGDWDKAEARLSRALAIFEKSLGPDHPNVAASLQNLAGIFAERGRFDRAEEACRRALGIWEKSLGPEHAGVADCLARLGRLCGRNGKEEEASSLLARAREIASRRPEKAVRP